MTGGATTLRAVHLGSVTRKKTNMIVISRSLLTSTAVTYLCAHLPPVYRARVHRLARVLCDREKYNTHGLYWHRVIVYLMPLRGEGYVSQLHFGPRSTHHTGNPSPGQPKPTVLPTAFEIVSGSTFRAGTTIARVENSLHEKASPEG